MKIILLTLITIIIMSNIFAYIMVITILDRHQSHQQGTDTLSKDPNEAKLAVEILCGNLQWQEYFYKKSVKWYQISFDQLKLQAYFLKNNETHRYVILCHGYTGSHKEMLGRAQHLYQNGFSILVPDARAHGESEGRYRGMGYLERIDIQYWIQQIINQDQDASITLFGQSMGGATVLMASGEILPDNVKAIISDCGYTSVWSEFSLQLKKLYHLPAFPIMYLANIFCYLITGYSFKQADALKKLKDNHIPVLFIHGCNDEFVPFQYMEKLYQAANDPKHKLEIQGAGHCMSIVKNNNLYWETVDNFLNKYL